MRKLGILLKFGFDVIARLTGPAVSLALVLLVLTGVLRFGPSAPWWEAPLQATYSPSVIRQIVPLSVTLPGSGSSTTVTISPALTTQSKAIIVLGGCNNNTGEGASMVITSTTQVTVAYATTLTSTCKFSVVEFF